MMISYIMPIDHDSPYLSPYIFIIVIVGTCILTSILYRRYVRRQGDTMFDSVMAYQERTDLTYDMDDDELTEANKITRRIKFFLISAFFSFVISGLFALLFMHLIGSEVVTVDDSGNAKSEAVYFWDKRKGGANGKYIINNKSTQTLYLWSMKEEHKAKIFAKIPPKTAVSVSVLPDEVILNTGELWSFSEHEKLLTTLDVLNECRSYFSIW